LKSKVVVFGQGYVGLPLAVVSAQAGHSVVGIDPDIAKVSEIKAGESKIEDISNKNLKELLLSGKYQVQSETEFESDTEIICVCVPTPLGANHQPDLRFIQAAAKSVGRSLKPEMLIIIESTIQPGATRNVILPILEEYSGLQTNQFLLAYSPERIDPMNKNWTIHNTPKLVAGLTQEAAIKTSNFYASFISKVDICESLEVAETAKLLENSFRFVNISFINELAIFCQRIGIDIRSVIKSASTKPYGFMPFYPSVGIGGHCIPVDPMYLVEAAQVVNVPMRSIEIADQINKSMPGYFVKQAFEILGTLENKKILVVGLSYKPNVSDVRESPVISLLNGLRKAGAIVNWHDDLVKKWEGETSTSLNIKHDLAILATQHDYVNLHHLGDTPVLDTRSFR
jgi:UDP-N-acetyl-D-glucosamine dehydrogenase